MLSYSCHAKQKTDVQSQTRKKSNKRTFSFATIAQSPERVERKGTLSYCLSQKLLRNFASCSARGRLKKTKSFSLSCVRQAQWTFNTNGSCYTMKLPFLHSRFVEGLSLGAGLRKAKSITRKRKLHVFHLLDSYRKCMCFPVVSLHFSPPSLYDGSSVNGVETIVLTMIVNPFSLHCVHVWII